MNRLIRKTLLTTACLCKVEAVLRKWNHRPRVIFWHGVSQNRTEALTPENISYKDFIRQLDYLKRYYNVISMDEYYSRRFSGKWDGREVVLTFDDGYRNNRRVAMELLSERQLPFTVFVSTAHVDSGELFPTSLVRVFSAESAIRKLSLPSLDIDLPLLSEADRKVAAGLIGKKMKHASLAQVKRAVGELRRTVSPEAGKELELRWQELAPMNWNEVREIQRSGWGTIASHCMDHCCCHTGQDSEEVWRQLAGSKEKIERELQVPCHYFAYPNGDFTRESNEMLRKIGYRLGFSTGGTKHSTICDFAISRINVNAEFGKFKLLLELP